MQEEVGQCYGGEGVGFHQLKLSKHVLVVCSGAENNGQALVQCQELEANLG